MPESEWNAEQLAWLEALEEHEAGLCRCGEPLAESTKLEHDFNNPQATAVYLPVEGTPVQCHACAALHRSEKATADLNPQHPGALIHAVRLVPRG
ncbi:hypothetical protein [Micromonospora inyonensis]|uniref:Uncharacterized protein n=1 Tax=Micromonospora inyonensis TaxID=47866 RepID=A0A1C6RWY3_9ACTN|nr:hypothetical protein [Micromonospora inyonensis]SCL21718.1 hypothetical protein GA0074694_3123 [Micromonospora inyonensis]